MPLPPRAPTRRRLLLLLPAVLLVLSAAPPNPAEQPIGAGEERRIACGSKDAHPVAAAVGQFIQVTVQAEQRVILTLTGPSGKALAHAESPPGGGRRVHLSAVAEEAGAHVVEVAPAPCAGAGGRYRLQIQAPRDAAKEERAWVRADRDQAEAARLAAQGTADGRRQALQRYRDVREQWRRLAEPSYEAEALIAIADVQNDLGARDDMKAVSQEALSLCERIDDLGGQAEALNNLGLVEWWAGRPREAIESFERLTAIAARLGSARLQALALYHMGLVRSDRGETRAALGLFERSRPHWQEAGNLFGEAVMLVGMGSMYRALGERDRALSAYESALALARTLDDPRLLGGVLGHLGALSVTLGEPERALEALRASLTLTRKAGSRLVSADTLDQMGKAYCLGGEYPRCIEVLTRALALARQVGNPTFECEALIDLGSALRRVGRYQQAQARLQTALALARRLEDRLRSSAALLGLGRLFLEQRDLRRASAAFEEALAVSTSTDALGSRAEALHGLAEVAYAERDLAGARRRADAAVELLESLRARVAGSEARSAAYVSAQQTYELAIEVLMAEAPARSTGEAAKLALEMSERKRARSLLDSLAESRSEIAAGVEPALGRRHAELSDRLRALVEKRRSLPGTKHPAEDADALAGELRSALDELQDVEGRLQATRPAYLAFVQGAVAGAAEVQALLDEDTVLLEFSLGERGSYGWAVTREGVEAVRLPPRRRIAAAARALRAACTSPARSAASPSTPAGAALRLSRMLLPPLAAYLRYKRLVVAADGILHHVPFAVLPEPGGARPGQPLLARHEIVLVPSASILKALRAGTRREPAPKTLAVLADPVYEADDPRVGRRAGGGRAPAAPPELQRAARDVGLRGSDQPFARLPFSSREAASIAERTEKLAPAGSVMRAVGFAASRDTALAALGDFRIVHFAAHGVLDNRNPGRSGLVLSLVDPMGRPQDGYLRLRDIYNLRLKAELVVLSACRTALGKEVRGEGMLSVVRGFMYAGAPRVVASLWDIDDRVTAVLMSAFYEAMLEAGAAPGEALRKAQLAVRSDRRWRHPYYWAGFVVEGEWR